MNSKAEYTQESNSTLKKTWVEPIVEIIDQSHIESGPNVKYTENVLTPGPGSAS